MQERIMLPPWLTSRHPGLLGKKTSRFLFHMRCQRFWFYYDWRKCGLRFAGAAFRICNQTAIQKAIEKPVLIPNCEINNTFTERPSKRFYASNNLIRTMLTVWINGGAIKRTNWEQPIICKIEAFTKLTQPSCWGPDCLLHQLLRRQTRPSITVKYQVPTPTVEGHLMVPWFWQKETANGSWF